MAKRTSPFSDFYLKAIKPKEKEFTEREPNTNGFGIRVHPSGTVTFYYFYSVKGKKKKVCLGDYPGLPLADAREIARTVHTRRLKGEWPLIPEPAPPPPPEYTLQDLWDHYYKTRNNDCRLKAEDLGLVYTTNPRLEGERRYMENDVLPDWGTLAVDAVSRAMVNRKLEAIADPDGERNAPHAARNLFQVLRQVYNFGISTGEYNLDISPCFKIKAPGRDNIRKRNLAPVEIKLLWHILDTGGMNSSAANGLKLLLLTGQRPSMVAQAPLAEFNGDWWDMPPARTQKNECPHRLFVVPTAQELLDQDERRTWAFPLLSDPSRSINRNDLNRVMARICAGKRWPYGKYSPNDLRRTVATQLQALGIRDVVIDEIQHHIPKGVRAHYNQYKFDKEKREALLKWEARLKVILATEYDEQGNPIEPSA